MICKNCGHNGSGSYCSNCGQKYEQLSKPFGEILADLFGALNIDSSIFSTLVPFLFRPGFLTTEYIEGRRKKYMSPVRLYLFLSVVFFFIAREASRNPIGESSIVKITHGSDTMKSIISSDSELVDILSSDSLYYGIAHPEDSLDRQSYEKSERLRKSILKASGNTDRFINVVYRDVSYIMFVLMPVLALLLLLLFFRKKQYYIEHLLFSVNMHSFALLVLSVVLGIKILIPGDEGYVRLLILVLPVYFTIGMKRFYRQGLLLILIKELVVALVYLSLLLLSLWLVVLFALYHQ